jgi:hypothetical protein
MEVNNFLRLQTEVSERKKDAFASYGLQVERPQQLHRTTLGLLGPEFQTGARDERGGCQREWAP